MVRERDAVVREYVRVTETDESLSERRRERSRLENLGIGWPILCTSGRKAYRRSQNATFSGITPSSRGKSETARFEPHEHKAALQF